jgi:cyclophilin family peptidyl-prolyl cis-trans isomerase
MSRFGSVALATMLLLAACGTEPTPSPPPPCPEEAPTSTSAQASLRGAGLATVTVTGAVEGEFAFELYGDAAPIATASFVELARCGFYDGIAFHRIIAGFVIQAGDPVTTDPNADPGAVGRGGPGYRFEIERPPDELTYERYSVSMANDTVANGSQFFVAVADLSAGLPPDYTIFGQVVSGTDTVDAIAAVPVDDPRVGRPLERVEISTIEISGAPSEDD